METTGKKRGGRPPKAGRPKANLPVAHVTADSFEDSNDGSQVLEISALAISPIPEDLDNSPSGSNINECRRSSRKKIIKFDVRDLLNKNRKPHKIQIEARIDSNAPAPKKLTNLQATTSSLNSALDTVSSAANKQKNFLEKSAIFEKYAVNASPVRPPPTPTLIVNAINKEIDVTTSTSNLLRARRNSSLIVAKMESTTKTTMTRRSSITAFSLGKEDISGANLIGRKPRSNVMCNVENVESVESEDLREETVQAPKKRRGRAPKVQPATLETSTNQVFLKEEKKDVVNASQLDEQLQDSITSDSACVERFTDQQYVLIEDSTKQDITTDNDDNLEAVSQTRKNLADNDDNLEAIAQTRKNLAQTVSSIENSDSPSVENVIIPDDDNTSESFMETFKFEGSEFDTTEVVIVSADADLSSDSNLLETYHSQGINECGLSSLRETSLVDDNQLSLCGIEDIKKEDLNKDKISEKSSENNSNVEVNSSSDKPFFPRSICEEVKISNLKEVEIRSHKTLLEEEDNEGKCINSIVGSDISLGDSNNEKSCSKKNPTMEETKETSKQEKNHKQENTNKDLAEKSVKNSHIDDKNFQKHNSAMPLKTKISMFLQNSEVISEDDSTKDSVDLLKETSLAPFKNCSSRSDTQSPLPKKTTRRSDRRAQIGAKAKTLEEMFAEIAAVSSREVLESPQTVAEEDSSSSSNKSGHSYKTELKKKNNSEESLEMKKEPQYKSIQNQDHNYPKTNENIEEKTKEETTLENKNNLKTKDTKLNETECNTQASKVICNVEEKDTRETTKQETSAKERNTKNAEEVTSEKSGKKSEQKLPTKEDVKPSKSKESKDLKEISSEENIKRSADKKLDTAVSQKEKQVDSSEYRHSNTKKKSDKLRKSIGSSEKSEERVNKADMLQDEKTKLETPKTGQHRSSFKVEKSKTPKNLENSFDDGKSLKKGHRLKVVPDKTEKPVQTLPDKKSSSEEKKKQHTSSKDSPKVKQKQLEKDARIEDETGSNKEFCKDREKLSAQKQMKKPMKKTDKKIESELETSLNNPDSLTSNTSSIKKYREQKQPVLSRNEKDESTEESSSSKTAQKNNKLDVKKTFHSKTPSKAADVNKDKESSSTPDEKLKKKRQRKLKEEFEAALKFSEELILAKSGKVNKTVEQESKETKSNDSKSLEKVNKNVEEHSTTLEKNPKDFERESKSLENSSKISKKTCTSLVNELANKESHSQTAMRNPIEIEEELKAFDKDVRNIEIQSKACTKDLETLEIDSKNLEKTILKSELVLKDGDKDSTRLENDQKCSENTVEDPKILENHSKDSQQVRSDMINLEHSTSVSIENENFQKYSQGLAIDCGNSDNVCEGLGKDFQNMENYCQGFGNDPRSFAKYCESLEKDSLSLVKTEINMEETDSNDISASSGGQIPNNFGNNIVDIERLIAVGVKFFSSEFSDSVKAAPEEIQNMEESKMTGEFTSDVAGNESVSQNLVLDSGEQVTLTLEDLSQKSFYTDSAYAEAHELMDPMMSTYLTPANTPGDSPMGSPCPESETISENSQSYYEDESPGVRRSHRLKQNIKGPKEGRGLVREKERVLMKEDGEMKIFYSLDDHLTDLAEVEAFNANFLKEMMEPLCNFQVIRENEYHCEKVISKEAKRMLCECFLTPDEEDRGELACGDDCLNRLLMIECGSHCKVKERCTNKRFQKQFYAPCRVFRTEKKGFGIMADVEILPGEFIMEYVGEVINGEELKARQIAYSKDKNRHYYFMALRGDTTIDATAKGNISRFINHSCDPNAETQKWTVNGELRIGFFSLKSIKPGEEITFNYQYERYGRAAQRCYCESSNCTGWIGEEPNSDEDEQVDGSGSETDEAEEDEEDEEEEAVEAKVARGLSECLGNVDDESSDDDIIDAAEAQKKLEMSAAEASLTEALTPEERQKIKNENDQMETGFGKDAKAKLRFLFNKIKERAKEKEKLKKEKKIQRRRKRKVSKSEIRTGPCEDPELEDELNFLIKCGLKNQSDTLRLSRLMVRAKLLQTRLDLLKVLTIGELACRRLFLDYNGLHLLHGWMIENAEDLSIRSAILEALKNLPIANKTILKDAKVFQAVLSWSSGANTDDSSQTSPSEESISTDSPKENRTETPVAIEETNAVATNKNETESEELDPIKKLAAELINNWNNLPEIFRIPKKERIEQMKEHEREADLQYEAAGEDVLRSSYRDRYGRDRYSKGTESSHYTDARRKYSHILTDESLKHLTKEQRRQLFAAKVAKDEEERRANEKRREFETKCRFFGLDMETTNPEDMPFFVNHDTGQWYSIRNKEIETPPAYVHVAVPPKPKSTNPEDYELPDFCASLPQNWKYALTPEGYIYYYHIEHRVPQWEPPTLEQINELHSDSDSEVNHEDDETLLGLNDDQIKEFIKKKAAARVIKRSQRLSESRPISPRKEEDRLYNQIEMRKYKENKEKIKRRKERLRRRAMQLKKSEKAAAAAAAAAAMKAAIEKVASEPNAEKIGPVTTTTKDANGASEKEGNAPVAEKDTTAKDAEEVKTIKTESDPNTEKTETDSNVEKTDTDPASEKMETDPTVKNGANVSSSEKVEEECNHDAIPIPDYLLSSDDETEPSESLESEIPETSGNCIVSRRSSLLDVIVDGDKIVDELDAITLNKTLKRSLPPHGEIKEFSRDSPITNIPLIANEKSDHTIEHSSTSDHAEPKKRKLEKKEKLKKSKDSSESKLRRQKERFRHDIGGIITHYLKPYYNQNCTKGRIENEQDFRHLCKKLVHFVLIKEQKYCESIGQKLVVTESVKNKTREFIRKYMGKYGEVYRRSANDPEYKNTSSDSKNTSLDQ